MRFVLFFPFFLLLAQSNTLGGNASCIELTLSMAPETRYNFNSISSLAQVWAQTKSAGLCIKVSPGTYYESRISRFSGPVSFAPVS